MKIKIMLAAVGTPIGPNDAAVSGHAITSVTILVTNNLCVFEFPPDQTRPDQTRPDQTRPDKGRAKGSDI